MTEEKKHPLNLEIQNSPDDQDRTGNFDREKIIAQSLEARGKNKELPEHLQASHTIGVIRHGKTLSKKLDNEAMAEIDPKLSKDPPKGKDVPLAREEYNPETSSLYQQALAIEQYGFEKVTLYGAGDTVRNLESMKLLKQYLEELGILVEVVEKEYSLLGARKKRELSQIDELLHAGQITDQQLERLGFGTKHTLGNARVLDIGKDGSRKLYEESYTQTIQNAGDGISDIVNSLETKSSDPKELHLIVAYRTTIQAAEIKNSLEREKQGIDLHYSGPFAEMKLYGVTKKGKFQQREREGEHKILARIPQENYQETIDQLHKIVPDIHGERSLVENEAYLNQYLYQIEEYLEEGILDGKNNIVEYYLSQYPLVATIINDKLLQLYVEGHHEQEIVKIILSFLNSGFHNCSKQQKSELLDLYYKHTKDGFLRKQMFASLWTNDRDVLRNVMNKNMDFEALYEQLEASDEFLASDYFQIDSLTFGNIGFFELYKDQKLSINHGQGQKQTIQNNDLLHMKGNKYITAPGGSGKSMLAKYLLAESVRNGLHPDQVNLIHATDSPDLTIDSAKVIIIDGIDEAGITEQSIRKDFIDNHPEKTFYSLGRSFLSSVRGEQQTITLEGTLENPEEVIKHYEGLMQNHQAKQYKNFMKRVMPKLNPKDLNYLLLDALGLVSKSRSRKARSLMRKESLSRQEVYAYYLDILGERSFEKFNDIEEKTYENQFIDKECDISREDFLEHLVLAAGAPIEKDNNASGFYSYESIKRRIKNYLIAYVHINKEKNQYLIDTLQSLEIDKSLSHDDLVDMFLDSLIFTGILEKSSYKGTKGVQFSHKTVLDYFRSLGLDANNYKDSAYYGAIKNFTRNLKEGLPGLSGYKTVDDLKREIGLRLYALLDALNFDSYNRLAKIESGIALDLENDEVNKILKNYLNNNHEEIFKSLSNDVAKKYPGAPSAHRKSYFGGLTSFFCGFAGYYGGPRIREHLAGRLHPGIYMLLNSGSTGGEFSWINGYLKDYYQSEMGKVYNHIQQTKDQDDTHQLEKELANIESKLESIENGNYKEIKEIFIQLVQESFDTLEEICFGPITKEHALMKMYNYCFGDPEEDIIAVEEIIKAEKDKGNPQFLF